jgi:glucose/arabinose dehydrogenase
LHGKTFRETLMRHLLLASSLLVMACGAQGEQVSGNSAAAQAPASSNGRPFQVTELADLNEPWAMAFLPGDGGEALITEKRGRLLLWREGGEAVAVAGTPQVDYGGQGGFGDVIVHPDFANNGFVYLSWAEAGSGDIRGAAVGRARLVRDGSAARLEGLQVIWRQDPKVTGRGHYGHRLAFSPDGRHLFITSGDRQKFDPAQDMSANLGKVIRVTDAGGIPSDNPFYDQGGAVRGAIWSLGHRNPLGIAFAPDGQLWTHEMGPKGGDEMNRIERGANYGYPIVSNGDHYDGRIIPDHDIRPEFNTPEITWTPVISPAGLIFYSGRQFPQWRGSAFIGGLSSQALIRVEVNGTAAREAERWDMGARIREVEQGPDGSIYLLEDENDGARGRLLKLTPAR